MKRCKTILLIGLFIFAGLNVLGAQEMEGAGADRFSRLHLRAGVSFLSGFVSSDLAGNVGEWGFGDDFTMWAFLLGNVRYEYPEGSNGFPLDFALDYSLTRKFSVGLSTCALGRMTGSGCDYRGSTPENADWSMAVLVKAAASGQAYFLNASYAPLPRPGSRFSMRAGLGVGIGSFTASFQTESTIRDFDRHALCGEFYVGADYWPLKNISLGLVLRYRYVPNLSDEFDIDAHYGYSGIATYRIPASDFGLGGAILGLSVAYHL